MTEEEIIMKDDTWYCSVCGRVINPNPNSNDRLHVNFYELCVNGEDNAAITCSKRCMKQFIKTW